MQTEDELIERDTLGITPDMSETLSTSQRLSVVSNKTCRATMWLELSGSCINLSSIFELSYNFEGNFCGTWYFCIPHLPCLSLWCMLGNSVEV